jgi:hypothetical protein
MRIFLRALVEIIHDTRKDKVMTLEQLVIRNLAVLEQAPTIAEKIDETVMRAVDARVGEWASGRPEWWVEANLPQNKTVADEHFCYFGPKTWPFSQEENKYKAYYHLGNPKLERGEDGCWYFISALTGVVPREFGIRFEVDAPYITRLVRGAHRAWQNFLASQLAECQHLQSVGFRLKREVLFLPIHLALEDLASAYPDALSDAFGPLDEALASLDKGHLEIDSIVNAAAAQFPGPQP